jgi:hypothetical protein
MNRKQLREELSFLLNVTEKGTAQDFVTKRLDKSLDRAYNQVVERAKLHGNSEYFRGVSAEFTWTAGAQTLTVPTTVTPYALEDIYDVTNGEPGYPLQFGHDAAGGQLFWRDNETFQWGTRGGPGAAMTLRAVYQKIAENLTEDAEPELVPPQFHWLIVWQAAVLLRLAGDEKAPAAWNQQLANLELDFYKHMSRGRPLSMTNTIRGGDGAGSGPTTYNVADTSTPGDGLGP